MHSWSLPKLLAGLHDDIQGRLSTVRDLMGHPGSKGDASEGVWLDLLQSYLPLRYKAASAFVVDSSDAFSEQCDVVIFDRQYSPFIFTYEVRQSFPPKASMRSLRPSRRSTPTRSHTRRRRSPAFAP